MTCSCITFVGLIAITIMKRFSKNSVQPINISLISALQKDNIQAIHSSKSDDRQNTCELQAVHSHSRIINVAPILSDEQIFESLDNIDTIQPRAAGTYEDIRTGPHHVFRIQLTLSQPGGQIMPTTVLQSSPC